MVDAVPRCGDPEGFVIDGYAIGPWEDTALHPTPSEGQVFEDRADPNWIRSWVRQPGVKYDRRLLRPAAALSPDGTIWITTRPGTYGEPPEAPGVPYGTRTDSLRYRACDESLYRFVVGRLRVRTRAIRGLYDLRFGTRFIGSFWAIEGGGWAAATAGSLSTTPPNYSDARGAIHHLVEGMRVSVAGPVEDYAADDRAVVSTFPNPTCAGCERIGVWGSEEVWQRDGAGLEWCSECAPVRTGVGGPPVHHLGEPATYSRTINEVRAEQGLPALDWSFGGQSASDSGRPSVSANLSGPVFTEFTKTVIQGTTYGDFVATLGDQFADSVIFGRIVEWRSLNLPGMVLVIIRGSLGTPERQRLRHQLDQRAPIGVRMLLLDIAEAAPYLDIAQERWPEFREDIAKVTAWVMGWSRRLEEGTKGSG